MRELAEFSRVDSDLACLRGGGVCGALARSVDWSLTSLGAPESWPAALKTTLGILFNSRHPMFLWWGPDLIQFYNDAYLPSFGRGKHPTAMGQRGQDCWPEIWHVIGPQIQDVMERGLPSWHENQLVPIERNGRLEEVYWTYGYSPVFDEEHRVLGTLVVCQETTSEVLARRRAERAADDQRLLAEAIPQQVWTADPSGGINFVNQRVLDYFGTTADRVLGQAWVRFVHPADVPEASARWQTALSDGTDYEAEFRLLRADGSYRWHLARALPVRDAAGVIRQWFGTNTEDSENRELREQLREQTARLTLALAAASLGTWEHVPDTHATFWDARAKALFGLSAEEELDFARFVGAIHPEDLPGFFAGIEKAMDPAGNGECSLQYRVRRPGETTDYRWVEAHGHTTFSDGKAVRINGTLLDITERMRINDALREAARRKDEFLAILGHELRNPLAPIRTALELMQARDPDYARREREIIERQLKHVMRLVDDLMDLAQVTRGALTLKRAATSLASVVNGAVEMATPLLVAKRHHFEVDVPPELIVSVDAVRFAQVVANLLTNAARYTPEGGEIAVRARAEGPFAVLSVIDNGIGIAPSQLDHIFEPFVQVEREPNAAGQQGLGLGLSLVRDLVALHAGSISVESDGLGRGSRFSVRVALALDDERASSTPELRIAPGTGRRRVLVVDDNEDAAEMLAHALGHRGYIVATAHDGESALRLADDFQPEVAVLDLGLPVIDGYELGARLRLLLGPRLRRLVALTGYGQPEDRLRSRERGFDRHLVKPVEFEDLERALAED
jgi:PAS domain S-box-containing protein